LDMRLLFLPRLLRKDGMVTTTALVYGSNYEIIGVGIVQGPKWICSVSSQ